MSAKHTPGPWRLWVNEEGAFELTAGDIEDVRVIASRAGWRHNAEQAIANARLMAAAPELLETTKELATVLKLAMNVIATNDAAVDFFMELLKEYGVAEGFGTRAKALLARIDGGA